METVEHHPSHSLCILLGRNQEEKTSQFFLDENQITEKCKRSKVASYSWYFNTHLWVLQQHQSRSEGHLSISTPPLSSPCTCKEPSNTCSSYKKTTNGEDPPSSMNTVDVDVSKNACQRTATLRSFWAGDVDAVFILFNLNQNTSCIFNLHANKARYLDWKKYCFSSSLFFSFFFTHAVDATQVISVEATISGARLVFKMFALKYLLRKYHPDQANVEQTEVK